MYGGLTCVQTETDKVIRQWVCRAAQDDIQQRRRNSRYPFFRAASVAQDGCELRWFCRDISPSGIGLLHDQQLKAGKATVSVWLGKTLVDIAVDLRWCNPVEGGWWVSGGRLLKVPSLRYASLMVSAIGREVERRFHRRYPLFRPFTITEEDRGKRFEHRMLSLDISHGGISLLASCPLDLQMIRLQTRTGDDGISGIRGRVVSCRELQNHSFVIGVEFVSLQITELC